MKCLKLLPLAALLMLVVTSCYAKTVQSEISDALGIDVRNETILSHEDTHGGFHGDGEMAAVLQITDEDVVSRIAESWNAMPLTENLTLLIYGNEAEGYGPIFHDESWNPVFPKIENGYYLFIDRHSAASNSADDTDLFHRHSYNFTIAVFDADTNTLYYAELDT